MQKDNFSFPTVTTRTFQHIRSLISYLILIHLFNERTPQT